MPNWEKRDVSTRLMLIIAAGIVLCVVATGVFVWVGMRIADRNAANGNQPDTRSGQSAYAPAATPRLQTAPWNDLAIMRAHEESVLNSYGWVDRSAGTIHIPIQRAMELRAQTQGAK